MTKTTIDVEFGEEMRDCSKSLDEERYEREKSEDQARYQHYLDTGQHISNEEMMAWFDRLESDAEAYALSTRKD